MNPVDTPLHGPVAMTEDEVARALGAVSWQEMLARLDSATKIVAPRGALKVVGEAWGAMRVRYDLVQVRRGVDFIIGKRSGFTPVELADDLRFADMPNTFDDPTMPVACPRSETGYAAVMAESVKRRAELHAGRRLIASMIAIGAAVAFGAAVSLTEVPIASVPLLLFALWEAGIAWLQFGDLEQEHKGQQPSWSIRRSRVAKWLPLSWFGPEHE